MPSSVRIAHSRPRPTYTVSVGDRSTAPSRPWLSRNRSRAIGYPAWYRGPARCASARHHRLLPAICRRRMLLGLEHRLGVADPDDVTRLEGLLRDLVAVDVDAVGRAQVGQL